MSIELQAKLLRVLQDKRVRRLGALDETRVDVKIICSVNQDPRTAIREEKLRTDLYYRLGVVIVKLPPLRERLDTMGELTDHFIKKYNIRLGTNVRNISSEVMELFLAYHWPGNIRELEHLIEGAMNMVGQDEIIGIQHFDYFDSGLDGLEQRGNMAMAHPDPSSIAVTPENFPRAQKQREEAAVNAAMVQTGGNVTQAAKILGISRQLLHYKLKKIRVSPYRFSAIIRMPENFFSTEKGFQPSCEKNRKYFLHLSSLVSADYVIFCYTNTLLISICCMIFRFCFCAMVCKLHM